jgi:AcrR family transcriptional regulator
MMSTDALRMTGGKVARRREAKIATIVEAAWTLSNEEGVAALSLHGLARKVGMRQPSLYEYFSSKNALYDAMFADGTDGFSIVSRPPPSRVIHAPLSRST